MQGLTFRQQQILDYITRYIDLHHYSPSLEEIKIQFNYSSLSTVHEHLAALKKKGFLAFEKNSKRSIALCKNTIDSKQSTLPIAGFFSTGLPLELFPNQTTFFSVDDLINEPQKGYCLKVMGLGLMEDLIVNNDLLLIEATSCITSGDAVICSLITGPTYLKKIFFEGQKVRLEPLNPLSSVISEIFKKEEVIIRGKLIKIIRSF